jgi:RNA polymerase sigma-70 factor (ECF subfamily)
MAINEDSASDAELVQGILAGDVELFSMLVKRYSDGLYRFCLARLGSTEEAEDAVQDALIRAYKFLGSYDQARSFSAWLFGIAANRVRSRYGKRQSETALIEKASIEAAGRRDLDEVAGDTEALALAAMATEEIRAVVSQLDEPYRLPVELYYFAGLKVVEVAETLGLGTEAVKTRLFRARKELSSLLDIRMQPEGRKRGRY